MKNLSIFIHSLASGGAERVVSILLKELEKDFNITLILMNPTIHYEIPPNQHIIYLDHSSFHEHGILKFLKLPILGWRYKTICQKNTIDISLSLTNRPNFIAILSKLFGNHSKILISERAQPSLQHKNNLQGFINKFLIFKLYPLSDTVIANSYGNRYDLYNTFKLESIQTIYNPFNLQSIANLAKMEIPFSKTKFTFVTVGRLDDGKNHLILLEAIKTLDAQLWIIGEGSLRNQLEKFIFDFNLEEKVKLLGLQSNPFAYIAKADCFVFSSNHEGFPNVIVEALSCEKTVISTDCQSGPREILAPLTDYTHQLKHNIELAEYGILTPINNSAMMTKAMDLIMNDVLIRNTYENKSKYRALDFEKSKIIRQYQTIIEA